MGYYSMNRRSFIFFAILFSTGLFGCSEKLATNNDFQAVCAYFQELEKLEDVDALTAEQRNNFIVVRIKKNISDSAASISWEAVSYAAPEQRYEIFKMGAESALNETWNCPAMEKLAPLTGAVE